MFQKVEKPSHSVAPADHMRGNIRETGTVGTPQQIICGHSIEIGNSGQSVQIRAMGAGFIVGHSAYGTVEIECKFLLTDSFFVPELFLCLQFSEIFDMIGKVAGQSVSVQYH